MMRLSTIVTGIAACGLVWAQPMVTPWPGEGSLPSCAAAALNGWYAVVDSRADTVELRSHNQELIRTVTRAELLALLPWMNFNTDADGPIAAAFSDSGRLLFLAVADSISAPDGQPSDAVVRLDTLTGELRVFQRIELGGIGTNALPRMVHHKGRLYIGYGAVVRVYLAGRNDPVGTLITNAAFGAASSPIALAVDREAGMLLAGNETQLSRASIGGASLSFNPLGTVPEGIGAITWGDHYGGAGQAGLYIAHTTGGDSAAPRVSFLTPAMARGLQSFSPTIYWTADQAVRGLCATPDGRLLATLSSGLALTIADASDTRLSFHGWAADEFAQVVRFGKSLISPDGEPPGWVIDGDVQLGWNRFHPATPDAAAWTILLLLANHRVHGDAEALPLVKRILTRYAGRAPGPGPARTVDGIFRHWIDPATGGAKPGWDAEFSTMSTMKIILAAARARAYFPGDPEIRAAAETIICGTTNWDAFFQPGTSRMYLKALASGGPDLASASGGWHEGVLFAEQAGAYGVGTGIQAADRWLDRSAWPLATFVVGRGVTSNGGAFLPSFVTLYPLLLIGEYRHDPGWRTNLSNLALSNCAWNDDNSPRLHTVFSAGTTRGDWGGYHADSISDHPGDVTTFPSLLAFCADPGATPNPGAFAVAAYHAYRAGARQTFRGGASILYRRSQVDPGYQPNSAGLPDVALGGLGLAELLVPGTIDATLIGSYPACGRCPSDWNGDGGIDGADVESFYADWEAGEADINGDGATEGADVETFFTFWESGC